MTQTLSDHDRDQLDRLVAETEKNTNTQIVLAVIRRSDNYEELPWKAFALGASVAGLVILILNLFFCTWYQPETALLIVAATLAGGFVFALLTVLEPGFAKWFLSAHRAKVEVKQYAQSLFLQRELFATSRRTGILLLVSLFERKVVVLPDKGLNDQLTKKAMKRVIAEMTPLLKRKKTCEAFEAGLKRLSRILAAESPGIAKNELPDQIIEEKGV
ncbi:TPM domain-containing protein [bacterium]|nr:TPM domain-containing protein [bacterium]